MVADRNSSNSQSPCHINGSSTPLLPTPPPLASNCLANAEVAERCGAISYVDDVFVGDSVREEYEAAKCFFRLFFLGNGGGDGECGCVGCGGGGGDCVGYL